MSRLSAIVGTRQDNSLPNEAQIAVNGRLSPDESKASPIGLYNYAHSYWACAAALIAVKINATHKDSPTAFLFFHAVELYLKAFLRARGAGLDHLATKVGHDVRRAAREAEAAGLMFDDEDREVLDLIPENFLRSRYIVVGAFRRPTFGALHRTCTSLHDSVGNEMIRLGLTTRLGEPPNYTGHMGDLFES